ncbi:solute carrier family 43 member 3-like isoform X1 [Centruroides sculpturatus]|uniref:solute carrier family 43 member 3-like isoform X1 n=1 Tax=Centruroides sculpturatus TaxID=218467 RepID=UPI000C6DDC17|nr:solute carrier family 43 member 3-like isoform X1 [Centruroides sculpturatus]
MKDGRRIDPIDGGEAGGASVRSTADDMRRGVRWLILLTGALETVVFTGNIFGWAALNYMLKRQGVYRHLCPPSNFTLDANATVSQESGCHEQDQMLNLAFTVGSFCTGFTAFVWGFLLDSWGLRTVRLLINGLIASGTIMLSVTNPETSYLIFPGLTLMCLAGVPLRIANMQIANLFPKQRSTVISFYSGGFSASASVFAFLKYLLDAGVSWEWTWFVLVACSAVMLPVTLFLLPPDRIGDDNKSKMFSGVAEVAVVSPVTFGKFSTLPKSPVYPRKNPEVDRYDASPADPYPPRPPPGKGRVPLRKSLLSFSFLAHQYWFSWVLLYTVIYIGTLHLWIERVTTDSRSASGYTEIYGLVQITGLVLAPLGGAVMDFFVGRAAKEEDPLERRLKTARAAFFPMLITTLTEAAIHVCRFFFVEAAIYASIALITLLRSSFVGVGTAYLRTRFPADHFNRLLGIMSTAAAFYTLLQFPFFVWEAESRTDSLYVNGVYCVLLAVALVHPLLMTVTPLQRRLMEKESARQGEGEAGSEGGRV